MDRSRRRDFGGTLAFDSAVAGAWNVAGKRFAGASMPMFAVSFVAGFAAGNAIYLQIVKGLIKASVLPRNP